MLEPASTRAAAVITGWDGLCGSVRTESGAVYAISLDQYRPDSTNFVLPAAGVAVEVWRHSDGSGTVESITFNALPRKKPFWHYRSLHDLNRVVGRRFEIEA